MSRALIRTCPWDEDRYGWALELRDQVKGAELVEDRLHNAFATFLAALHRQGKDDAWHLEDDIELTSRWREKAAWVERLRRYSIIQAFSNRKDDLTVGSRWAAASGFLMIQCFYVPAGLAEPMLLYGQNWLRDWDPEKTRWAKPHADVMVSDFMRHHKLRYWIHCPSLVQHREVSSLIATNHHAKGRQSRSYVP